MDGCWMDVLYAGMNGCTLCRDGWIVEGLDEGLDG